MKVAIGLHRDHIDDWQSAALYAQEAEKLGVDAIWSAEAWGYDGITPLAYLAGQTESIGLGTGIIQGGTRTPALVGMTAMSLQSMSGGRFRLGLGTSGPQVVEGWHGVPFAGAVIRLAETAEIVRKVCNGERLVHRRRRQPRRVGEARDERPVAREHRLDARLLEHDLRDPNTVRVLRAAPRQIAPTGAIPFQEPPRQGGRIGPHAPFSSARA